MTLRPPSDADARRWQAASALFDEALDQPAEALTAWRQALLRREPAVGAEVLAELDRLLAAHATAQAADPMAEPPVLGPRPAPDRDLGPRAGLRIGPWQLVSRLGEGGMAEVWRARRADGAYEREVALKLPRHLPWRGDLADRLARERDILARLSHPHIARLYDAGLSAAEEAGQPPHPWLAMELVDGASMLDWCNARQMPLRERVQLFQQVLGAVAHAHTLLVLHRDLKPSNILVNQAGEVRLLDFGIAKLLNEADQATADTRLTQLGGRALTPDYASPEQLRGEPLTTASDVYSLGVVLYELLCGELPYRLRHRSAAQVETAVLEADPKRPSTRPGTEHAQARGLTPRRLSGALRGDLDAIVLTALRKDPAQRYAGAADLKADLQRWLDGLPVLAQPDSVGYRAWLFTRRHRIGVAMTALVASVLIATTVVSVRQSDVARREASRAKATRDFLLGLYKPLSWLNANPARGGQVTARELLDLSAEQLQSQPVQNPEVQRDMLRTLGDLYHDVDSKDGQLRIAEALLAHTDAQFGRDSPERFDALVRLSEAQAPSNVQRATATLAQATALKAGLRRVPVDSEVRYWLAMGAVNEGRDAVAAEQAYEAVIRITEGQPDMNQLAGKALAALAGVRWYDQGRLAEAGALYERALSRLRGDPTLSPLELIKPDVELAELEARQGHFERARALFEQAYQLSLDRLGPSNTYTIQTGWRMAALLRTTGQAPLAMAQMERLLATVSATPAMMDDVETLPDLYREVAAIENDLGRWADAERHIGQAWRGLVKRQGDRPNASTATWLAQWAYAQTQLGQAAKAAETLRRLDDTLARVPNSPRMKRNLAMLRARMAVLLATPGGDASAVVAALDTWAQLEEEDIRALSAPAQARARAVIDLWRGQAWLFMNQAPKALTAAMAATARLDESVLAALGHAEQAQAMSLAAEARWRMGEAAPACKLAAQAQPLLDQTLPGSPEDALMHALSAGCGPHAQPAPDMRAVLAPPHWQVRWRAVAAR